MFYVIDRDTKNLKAIEPSTFRELNIWERKDIEKWIENYPAILGEDLFVITTEYDKFDKTSDRLDILAIDRNGKLVIIELKRDMAPSAVELQAIKYAAFCSNHTIEDIIEIYSESEQKKGKDVDFEQAESEIKEFIQNDNFKDLDDQPRIILVAQEFKPDTTSSIFWLRTFGVDIKCVKLEAYSIEDSAGKKSVGIKPSIIIPLPEAKDYIVDRERKETASVEMTLREKFFRTLYDRLITRFKNECPGITERGSTTDSWLGLPVGYAGMHFEWTYKKRPKPHFMISFDLEKTNYDENNAILTELESYKDEFEKLLNEKVTFEHRWGKKWCQFYVTRESIEDEKALDDWIIETTKKFYKYIKPRIDEVMAKI